MLAEYHDAGLLELDNGKRIRLRMPLQPRAPRYRCPQCANQVTADALAETPGAYLVECQACKLVTKVIVTIPFFVVTS